MSIVSFGAPALIAMALAPVLAGNALALSILRITGLFQILDGLQNLAAAISRGLEDTRTPLWAAMLSFWPVGAGSAYALCFWAGLGLPGLWAGLCMGFGTAGLLVVCSLARRRTRVLRAKALA